MMKAILLDAKPMSHGTLLSVFIPRKCQFIDVPGEVVDDEPPPSNVVSMAAWKREAA